MAHRAGIVIALVIVASPLAAAPPRAGGEFLVNTYTTGRQFISAVAAAPDGRFVVVWESFDGQDGDLGGIFGQLYDAAGRPVGSEFQVNTYTTKRQFSPAVAMGPAGDFVVVWTDTSGEDGSSNGIFAQHFAASGARSGGELLVNEYTTGGQFNARVSADGSGNFVVVWQGNNAVYGRRFDSAMTGGSEFPVSTDPSTIANNPGVAANADGSFVAAWGSFLPAAAGSLGILARRFDAAGAPLGAPFLVSVETTQAQDRPRVAALGGGSFVVVWHDNGQDGDSSGIFGRRFDSAGAPLGGEFAVNTYTTSSEQFPEVAPDGAGGFMVVWESAAQDGSLFGVFGRSFDATGAALDATDFLVNTNTINGQRSPAIAGDADGRFVVAWHGSPEAGGSYGVHGQRFGDLIFKDGFESGGLTRWSSAATDAGDLTTSVGAALGGTTIGLSGTVNDVNSLYVQDDSPAAEGRYRARFYIDPKGFDPGEAQGHRRIRTFVAFSEGPSRRVAAIVLKRQAGVFSLMARARRDDNTQVETGFVTVSGGPHVVELDLVRATAPGALDGRLDLWIDGASVATIGSLDNSLGRVDFARLGALSVKTGAAGTLAWDEFESRRLSYIGPLP